MQFYNFLPQLLSGDHLKSHLHPDMSPHSAKTIKSYYFCFNIVFPYLQLGLFFSFLTIMLVKATILFLIDTNQPLKRHCYFGKSSENQLSINL